MLKIVFVIDSLAVGGAERLTVEASRELAKSGHDVTVIMLWSRGGFESALRESNVKLVCIKKTKSPISMLKALREQLRRLQPDIIHAHLTRSIYLTWAATLGLKVPVVVTEHSQSSRSKKYRVFGLVYRILALRFCRILAVSDEVRAGLIQWAKIEPAKINVVTNGLNLERFTGIQPPRFDPKRITVTSLARLDPRKNLLLLVDVAEEMSKSHSGITFQIVGEGPEQGILERVIMAKGLGDIVKLLGQRTDVEQILSGTDIYLITSDTEGLPLSLLEAMAAGRPIVSTAVGGIQQVLENGNNALTVEPRNAKEMALALCRFVDDPLFAEKLGENARLTAMQSYGINVHTEALLTVYRQAIH